ncbi:trypsin-like serine peptidase [Catelliglobosispora koreensis]|uniref:trypsin-like serine peptidase n=1 Tax=Catelliglobosispora koreensis TaxID=129052 RepID=UPI0003781831|nr:hypothetical protein [Catelliglobosispora koreensis]
MAVTTTRRRASARILTAFALTAGLALAVPQSAAAARDDAGLSAKAGVTGGAVAVHAEAWAAGRAKYGRNVTAAEAIDAFWTPERMRAARPIEESPEYARAMAKGTTAAKTTAPQAGAEARKPTVIPPFEGALGTPPGGGASIQAINPNFPSSHPTARTSGKAFFVLGGLSYRCSGTVVNSAGADTVWTAGHCVHSGAGGQLASSWAFVPAYDDDLANPRPFGTWSAVSLWTMTAWINSSAPAEDMAVAIMGTLNGNHIVSYLGGQGLWTFAGTVNLQNAFGYPAQAPFDGGNLLRCAGTSSQEYSNVWTETIKIPCNFNKGASGGGWLLNWDGNWGLVNGINSRVDQLPNPTIVASPYFDGTALALYDFTKNM